jgi:hypothetical protein
MQGAEFFCKFEQVRAEKTRVFLPADRNINNIQELCASSLSLL